MDFWHEKLPKYTFLGWRDFYGLGWVEFYRYQKFKEDFVKIYFSDKIWALNRVCARIILKYQISWVRGVALCVKMIFVSDKFNFWYVKTILNFRAKNPIFFFLDLNFRYKKKESILFVSTDNKNWKNWRNCKKLKRFALA